MQGVRSRRLETHQERCRLPFFGVIKAAFSCYWVGVCESVSLSCLSCSHSLWVCRYMADSRTFDATDPDPSAVPGEVWEVAEEAAEGILCTIRPTVEDDRYRREVVEYVRGLIKDRVDCEVFPYGSVPLKTYLPDGDIDLTAISTPNIENTLCSDVYAVLKGKEHNKSENFEVKDVYFINAEVKIVKCLVQNVVIDISFNQLGGLCTLCFLEKVDGVIGKNHLFKRSIIMIKCWCFYESRILGAHHGLLSTYALETLVLHVFHLFHSSLNGPLAVLYRFLDYFSKFDWENYCVNLRGAVCKSSLPDIVVKVPENGRDNLLLSEKFLQDCVHKFSAPSKGIKTNSRPFAQKHLNIIDALKENNNLGRSVSKGNFHRICSALKYGAHKLGQILLLPRERLADELNNFFVNTLARHQTSATHAEHSDTCHEDNMRFTSTAGHQNDKRPGFGNIERRRSLKMDFSQAVPEMNCTSNRNSVSGKHSALDAEKTLISRNGSSGFSTSFLNKESRNAPHDSGKIQHQGPSRKMPAKSVAHDDSSFAPQPESDEKSSVARTIVSSHGNNENVVPNRLALSVPASNMFEHSSSALRGRNSDRNLENSVLLRSLLDLSGHYESYFSNLIYSKQYQLSAPGLPSPLLNQLLSKNIWESIPQSPHLEPRACAEMKASGGVGSTEQSPRSEPRSEMKASDGLGPESYPVNPPVPANTSFSSAEKKKPQQTGTSFSKRNYGSNRNQPSSHRGRFSAPGSRSQVQRDAHTSSLVTAPTEVNLSGEGTPEFSPEEFPVLGSGKSASSDFHPLFPSVWRSSNVSILHKHIEVSLPEENSSPPSDTRSSDSTSGPEVPVVWSPDVLAETNEERDGEQLFHLKNEVDFPPLSLGRKIRT